MARCNHTSLSPQHAFCQCLIQRFIIRLICLQPLYMPLNRTLVAPRRWAGLYSFWSSLFYFSDSLADEWLENIEIDTLLIANFMGNCKKMIREIIDKNSGYV